MIILVRPRKLSLTLLSNVEEHHKPSCLPFSLICAAVAPEQW